MSLITITINTQNAAFGDNEWDEAAEVGRILSRLGDGIRLDDVIIERKVYDTNGNPVGEINVQSD